MVQIMWCFLLNSRPPQKPLSWRDGKAHNQRGKGRATEVWAVVQISGTYKDAAVASSTNTRVAVMKTCVKPQNYPQRCYIFSLQV